MTKHSITWYFETGGELLAFLERNKDLATDSGAKKPAGRPKKEKQAENDDLLDDDDDLGGDDDLDSEEEAVTLDTIKQMISTKSLDVEKKKKMKALLGKFGVEAASKLPSAKYKDFYEKLKII